MKAATENPLQRISDLNAEFEFQLRGVSELDSTFQPVLSNTRSNVRLLAATRCARDAIVIAERHGLDPEIVCLQAVEWLRP